ncbi:hypothetical protein ABPG72_015516 [Tetrahymena utriculariae]
MSQKSNIYEISQQAFDDSYSQHQICDKSCQKQLFQSRNLNVQNGLLGDNSFILSQVEVIDDQTKPDQLEMLQIFNEKTDQIKSYIGSDYQNKQYIDTHQQLSTKCITNLKKDQSKTQMRINLDHFEDVQNVIQNQNQFQNYGQINSRQQQDQSNYNRCMQGQQDQQKNKEIRLQSNSNLNKYLNLIKMFQQRIKNRKDGLKNIQQLLLFDDLIYGLYIKKQKLENYLINRYQFNYAYEVTKCIFKIIIVAHTVSIGWYIQSFIYSTLNPDGLTWINILQIQETEYYVKYMYSFYWAISALTTVGNGYMTVQNNLEVIYASISLIAFSLSFAYYTNCIGLIIQDNYKEKKKIQNNIYLMNNYLSKRQIDSELKYKIIQNLSSINETLKNQNSIQENLMFNTIPKNLREEVQIQCNKNILNSFYFFQNLSQKSQNQIVFILQELVIPQEEIIFKEGDIQDNSAYIIQEGCVQIYQQKSGSLSTHFSILCNLNKNQSFGEVSFFTGLARTASAKTSKTSTIYKLDRKKFIEIIKQNQGDYEYFKMIQDKIIYSQNFIDLKIKCYSCQQKGHILKYCPYIKQKQKLQINSLARQYQVKQKRQARDRKQFKSFNAKQAIKYFRYKEVQNNQSDIQISKNNLFENEYYSFQQIRDKIVFSNQQVVEPFVLLNNVQSGIKKQNFKESVDPRCSQQVQQDQNLSDVNVEFRQENSIQDHSQGFEMQESQMKVIKNKSKNTSFAKNQVTTETNSNSDIIMITNSKINIQHDEETLNVTSNLINDFQIKDIQKVKKPILVNQNTQNNEFCAQSGKNLDNNRCSVDLNLNLNYFQDMILNTNGQFIYDQIEDQIQASLVSPINLSLQDSVNKQSVKIEQGQSSPFKCQKNKLFDSRQSKQNEQKELDQTLENIKLIFSKYEQVEQPFSILLDSVKKYRYYFPKHNYDLILKQYQKYIAKRKKKFQLIN